MTNNKQERQEQRLAIINEALGDYDELMEYIQQYVVNEFMEDGLGGDDFYINNEEDVHSAFNTYTFMGQDVVDGYINSNKCGLSIKSINDILYAYQELALEMDLEVENNIGQMVNVIMFNIADTLSNHLEFE